MKAPIPKFSCSDAASHFLLALLCLLMAVQPVMGQGIEGASTQQSASRHKAHVKKHAATKSKKSTKSRKSRKSSRSRRTSRRMSSTQAARMARMRQAFVASAELQPMAQQLATLRTPEAYAGVTAYARRHTGESAAAAYLALGHAYLLDKRYAEADSSLQLSRKYGDDLGDYADYLDALASYNAGDNAAAVALLRGFASRYPDSIFVDAVPVLDANALLGMNDPQGARQALALAANTAAADRPAFQLAEGQVEYALGQQAAAAATFKRLLLGHPLSDEASTARARLTAMGAESAFTTAELRTLADAYYRGGRYTEAAEQYRSLTLRPSLSAQERNGFAVAEAACQLKLKRLTRAQAEALPDTQDENGARRLDLLMELARSRDDESEQQRIVAQMESRFPTSPWLEDALFSSGNMYLLKRDYPNAVRYYGDLAERFPSGRNAAAAHWRAGWLSYRQGLYQEAARLFDEQIRLYPAATETVSALYWRGKLYESLDRNPARAAANYRAIVRAYPHYFYAQMAQQRLGALGNTVPVSTPLLDRFQPMPAPRLVESFPSNSPHLAKARLLANAGLNEYIAREIAADPDSASWSALAEAQIYASYGQTFRALRAMKRALPREASASVRSIPLVYWRILFPEAWWNTIKAESAKNGLDPYMVASLIRQESEFNPSVVSYANAYGLMQLLPRVGRQMAREEGMRRFETYYLLDPETNIRLGTRYLRQMLNRFGGVQEYALAAYNAGDSRVADWQAAGPYSGMDEFVESIPFTQTREYVEAILRNEQTYREIDAYAHAQGQRETAQSR